MGKFVIEGGHPLNGVVVPSGNKNGALALLAATLLTDQQVVLENVPRIKDVKTPSWPISAWTSNGAETTR